MDFFFHPRQINSMRFQHYTARPTKAKQTNAYVHAVWTVNDVLSRSIPPFNGMDIRTYVMHFNYMLIIVY